MKQNKKATKGKAKKTFYKKWWFWLIIVILLGLGLGKDGESNRMIDKNDIASQSTVQAAKESEKTNPSESDIEYSVRNVHNDVTGNWRVAVVYDSAQATDIALDYYNKYFESDSEIHAIVNLYLKTTTKISVLGNILDVTIYEYVDKEEHDAKALFSGMLLKEYFIDKDTGEIEEIQ